MGWRDRDYATWTDEERRRFYGSGATFAHRGDGPPAVGRGQFRLSGGNRLLRPGAGLAVLASLAIALGQLPLHHPLVPALHVLGKPSSGPALITGPSTAALGSILSLQGTAPLGDGLVQIEGSYDGGRTWQALSSARSAGGAYAAQVRLSQPGELALKVVFADGSSATGSILVR